MSPPVLRFADASFGYRGVTAVHANLHINVGEVVALLGSNGSGKSTLVKGALGRVDSYGGDVEWFGQPFDQLKRQSVVGYVPQRQPSTSPIPSTLEELVRTGRLARTGMLGRYRPADRDAVAEAIRTVGLDGQHRTPVRELSGGQQRRALVARALASQADAIVLDEPFAGVDQQSQASLAGVFRDLVARSVTLVVVLHELGPLEGLITRVVQLAGGEVIFDGKPAEMSATLGTSDTHDPHCGQVEDLKPSTLGLLLR